MDQLLKQLQARFPQLNYSPGDTYCWSPQTNKVVYKAIDQASSANWSLLHETCHGALRHTTYGSDVELLSMEVAAWVMAESLGSELGITIDHEHIQDCLDSYRDWLYTRSHCPTCGAHGLQQSDLWHYQCFNCTCAWKVAPSRFCRAYRTTKHVQKKPVSAFHSL